MKYDYDRYQKCIYALVHFYSKRSGFSFDDLLSEANEGFLHTVSTYNADKACFHTYLHMVVKGRILNFMNKNKKKEVELNELHIAKTPNPEEAFIFNESINSLSKEAKEVVDTILNTPKEMIDLVKKMSSSRQGHMHVYKSNVTKYFKDKGWQRKKILKAYSEIKTTFGWS